jgi:3-deoxy-D-manno-octulosonic-acid transferase
MAVASELYAGRRVVRFPVEPGFIVERFLRRVRPVAVVLVELEIWPNFLRAANRQGIPVAVVNGRITERSYRSYRRFKNLLPQFNRISLYGVQGEEYARRFLALGVAPERVLWTGNVKADSLGDGPVEPGAELRALLGGAPGQLVLTAGSTHADEELQVARAWREHAPELRLVLVPRHPPRAAEVVEALRAEGVSVQRLSSLRAGEPPDPTRPALVDTIGELERVYGLSDLVFVGGTLVPHGGQNMLEPASQGRPVLHGPYVDNFLLEARLLREAGGSVGVEDAAELGELLAGLAADEPRRRSMAAAGLEVVRGQKGATARTLEALRERCLDPLEGPRNAPEPL